MYVCKTNNMDLKANIDANLDSTTPKPAKVLSTRLLLVIMPDSRPEMINLSLLGGLQMCFRPIHSMKSPPPKTPSAYTA